MTVGKKLSIAFSATFLLGIILAYSSVSSIRKLNTHLNRLITHDAKEITIIGKLRTAVSQLEVDQQSIALCAASREGSDVAASEQHFSAGVKQSRDLIAQLRPLLVTDEGRQIVGRLESALARWDSLGGQTSRIAMQGDSAGATALFTSQVRPLAEGMVRDADRLSELVQGVLERTEQAAESTVRNATVFALVLTGIFLVVSGLGVFAGRQITQTLQRLASEMLQGADQVSGAAAQVSASAQSVAQGSSQQAASLEETSASTEEINSLTHRNAENATSATQVAALVDARVTESNSALGEMVQSMQDITSSSDKISRIIKVIEEIAFQTNILALNAAVEAARAGEAGMGFAVVADEVRNLAQRSSQAARDTAALIEESIANSHNGRTRLEQVTAAFGSITESVSRVKTLIEEVHLGSQEQAKGIKQVAQAVSQMERVTQQTAAAAEESASAGEELSAQSDTLREVIARMAAMVGSAGNHRAVSHSRKVRTARVPSKSAPAPSQAARPKARAPQFPLPAAGKDFSLDGSFQEF